MRGKIFIELAAIVVVALGLWFLFTKIDLGTPDDTSLMSIETEVSLGELLTEEITSKDPNFQSYENDTAQRALKVIANRLIGALDTVKYDYDIVLAKGAQINAMTMLGGRIYVLRGLMSYAESPEELAGVLAHELGHAQERHVVRRLIKELGVTAVVAILTGGDPGTVLEVLNALMQSVFNRNQESRADEFGLALMEKAGIDPQHLADFFRRLEEDEKTYPKSLEILMTHPHHTSRIEDIEQYEVGETFREKPFFGIDWEAVRRNTE